METHTYHTPVLLQEVLSYLLTVKNGLYVDGTLGGGGHTEAILKKLDQAGRVIGMDLDDDAIAASGERLAEFGNRVMIIRENFKKIKTVLSQHNISAVEGILLDLGVSSFQLDEPEKGFSFRTDAPLDMRMDHHQQIDAKYILNQYDEQSLSNIVWKYGEEKQARRIAKALVSHRTRHPLDSTGQLASIVEQVVGGRFLNKTLARVFQAIRIEVNNEMENLQLALRDCLDVLNHGGRIVVLSYHSLEDRLVKEIFRTASARAISSGHKMIPDTPVQPILNVLTRKPITASEEENVANPRSRSAKLRAAEKI